MDSLLSTVAHIILYVYYMYYFIHSFVKMSDFKVEEDFGQGGGSIF